MITAYYKDFLSGPHAFWLASASDENLPDVIRCIGVVQENEDTLRCFFTEKFSARFRENIASNPQVSFLATHMFTFEGYQYKGESLQIEPATAAEIELQQKYMQEFDEITNLIGLDSEKFHDMYYSQPSYSILIKVDHIFEQIPKPNTGGEINI